jgi:hypothetical protein
MKMIPRLALILIFLTGTVFAYIESAYMRDHSAMLEGKANGVIFWMWFYRGIAVAFFFIAAFFSGSFFRR